MAILDDETTSQRAAANAKETKDLFAGDSNAESPFVIPSREVGQPFPQGIGGARVDEYIEARLQRVREAQGPQVERQPLPAVPATAPHRPGETAPSSSPSGWASRLFPRLRARY